MNKLCLILLLALFSLPSYGQEVLKRYVEGNTVAIKSIQPDNADYADLEHIGKAIGEARVVMLGEQGHGDGATFLAKTRLVKYLHQQKGFTVIAFESDFFGLNTGWDDTPKEKQQAGNFLKTNINSVWSRSKQCSDLLYNYIPGTYQTNTPLQISGFDNKVELNYSSVYLKNYIDKYLQQTEIKFVQTKAYKDEFLPAVESLAKMLLGGKDAELKVLDEHSSLVLSQLSAHSNQYEWLLLKNIQTYAAVTRSIGNGNMREANKIRDKQMAENLEWLVKNKFPEEKVIVWAANFHISKNATTAFKSEKSKGNWMGTVFTGDSLNNANTYVLGFASKTGVHQLAMLNSVPHKIDKPVTAGFEHWFKKRHRFAFVDFREFKSKHSSFSNYFAMKGHGHISSYADWTSVFDGVFFIKKMTPSERIK
jgi:erythromycin esterase